MMTNLTIFAKNKFHLVFISFGKTVLGVQLRSCKELRDPLMRVDKPDENTHGLV